MHSVDVHGLTTSSPQAIEGHPESGQELVPNLLTTSSLTLPQNSSWAGQRRRKDSPQTHRRTRFAHSPCWGLRLIDNPQ